MLNRLVNWAAAEIAVNSPLPVDCDLLACVAHGAHKSGLTRGAAEVATKTRELARRYPTSLVRFCAFAGSPDPKVEMEAKQEVLPGIYAGEVWSTIEECLAIKKSLETVKPRVIIVVTDEAHSVRCKMVWETFFPNSDIRIYAIPIEWTVDKRSPMKPYRKLWTILFFQLAPTPLFWWWCRKGPEYLATKAGHHQATAS